MTLTVFKVPGETNTDDLSPASEAFTRSDIPLHSLCMLGSKMTDPIGTIASLKAKGHPLAVVAVPVGEVLLLTGTNRYLGEDRTAWRRTAGR